MSADTPASADAAKAPHTDHARPAEPDHGRPAEQAPEQQHSDAGRSQQPAHALNRADYNAARHAEPPIRSHETATVRTPDSPARQPADRRTAAGNPDLSTGAAEGNSRTSEHHPDVRPVLTHFHAEFKGHSTDLYTDGTRWASGDLAQRGNVSAGRGEIPERLPTGEDLVDTAGEESSRIEKLRRELYDETGDLTDDIDAGANRLHDIFSPPPTSSYEATPVAGPHFSATQHPGMDVGAGAAALFALGLTIDRAATWAARHLEKRPERD